MSAADSSLAFGSSHPRNEYPLDSIQKCNIKKQVQQVLPVVGNENDGQSNQALQQPAESYEKVSAAILP